MQNVTVYDQFLYIQSHLMLATIHDYLKVKPNKKGAKTYGSELQGQEEAAIYTY